MPRPDQMKTPGGSRASGEAVADRGIDQTNHIALGASGPACQCRINPSGCLVCRRFDKIIRGIEARRADSLRRQSLGARAAGG
jgi:hypothetical protein